MVDVPAGPTCVAALWEPLQAALRGDETIGLVPESSPMTPPTMVDAITVALRPHETVARHIAVVLSTSGSTGLPRGVALSASALTSMTEHVNGRAGGEPTWVLALPPTSIGGLNVIIRAQATGRPPIPVSSIGGADRFTDAAFAAAIDEAASAGRPVAVSLVPHQLPRLLGSTLGRRSLATCDLILVGGAALAPQAARDCADAGIRITTTYGMTETSGGCVLDGRPLPGVEVRVEGSDGRIFLRGPMLADGYRDGANEAFDGGWLRTQDRGRWEGDRLQVLGRLDDVVMVKGVNVDLVAIEDRTNDHPAIDESIAVAINDDGGLHIHVIYIGEFVEHEDLRAWIAQTLGSPAMPAISHRVDSFALTSSGKIDRRATASVLQLDLAEEEL